LLKFACKIKKYRVTPQIAENYKETLDFLRKFEPEIEDEANLNESENVFQNTMKNFQKTILKKKVIYCEKNT